MARTSIQAETALALAYRCLLMVAHDSSSRDRIQPALASVRDEIARLKGRSPEFIQNYYELHAQEAPEAWS